MKKKIKIICIFAAVSFILQTGVLLILNNKVFEGFADDNNSPSKNIAAASEAEKKEEADKKEQAAKKETIKIDISSDAKNISIARSNKYIAYIEDDKINYVDTKTNEKKSVDDIVPQYYKWTADDNIVIAAKNKNYRNRVDIYIYDINENNLKKIQQIKLESSESKVDEIICSPYKNIFFVKVNNDNVDKLYKVNIKNEIETVETVTKNISSMAVIPHEDKIIYKSDALPKFYITYCDTKLKFNTENQMELLGVDEQDRIFAAEKDGDSILNIYSGRMNDAVDSWNKIAVNKKLNMDNIKVSDDGIYYLDKEKSVIINLEDNKETKIKGTVVGINKKEAFVKNENKIERIKL